MKRFLPILLLLCLLLTGCGGTKAPEPSAAATATPSPEQSATPVPASPEPVPVIPEGTWEDSEHPEVVLVIDEKCACSVSVIREDGSVTSWTFSGVMDPETGDITYSDCVRMDYAADATGNAVYSDGTGSLVFLDGYLYWHDDVDNAGADYRFRETN